MSTTPSRVTADLRRRAAEIVAAYSPDVGFTAEERDLLRQATAELRTRTAVQATTRRQPDDRDPSTWPTNSIPPQPDSSDLLGAVYGLACRAIAAAGRPVPDVGTTEWWEADDATRSAALMICAQAYIYAVVSDAERRKAASVAISTARDWSAQARRPSYAELQRRRAEPGPLARPADDGTGGAA